jgi:adenylate cyclase class 2
MSIEIEVKAAIRDTEKVRHALESLDCSFGEGIHQDDAVYVQATGSLETFLQNDVFLRVRVQGDGTVLLTAKKPIRKSPEELVKQEHEVVVSSADEARAILELMGYREGVRVRKIRRSAHHGAYEICLDEVEGLGTFIEIEQLGERDDARRIQEDMLAFLGSIGVAPENRVTKGYDILMLENTSV